MNLCIPKQAVTLHNPGDQMTASNPGDFIIVIGNSWWDKFIRFWQGFRFEPHYARFTHAALITDYDGTLIEADGGKPIATHKLSDYQNYEYYHVQIEAEGQDRTQMVAFARSCLNESYGLGIILSIGLSLLTGFKFDFGLEGQEICSGLVARALERTNAIFPVTSSHMCPAQLAKYYLGGETT